jgi:PAS domain S-box-containing protein
VQVAVGLLEGAPDAMVCVDRYGRIALVNAQTERLFGYQRDELVGQPVEILLPEMARKAHRAHRDQYVANPRPRAMGSGMELSARRRDGSTFRTEVSLSAIETDDGLLVIAAVRDVTERLELRAERERRRGQAERLRGQAERDKLEGQLQQAQRLESVGQLAGGVAHDFNNLLAVISNYAAFVGDEVAKDGPQVDWRSVREDVRQIQLAAGRAAELTHQLLAFARRDVVRLRPLDLNEVITRVEQLLIRTLDEHLVLKTDLAPQLCPVLADPGQIEQVLVNLAVNARDAMPSGGTLVVATSVTDVDESHPASRIGLPPGRYACMKISDTGVGMPRDVIDHAFEPFFTTKPKGEGTGLGLATVYGIVTQAGGHVQINSEPGTGTTVTILLPASGLPASGLRVSGQGIQAEPAPEHEPAGETVLIVEDEPGLIVEDEPGPDHRRRPAALGPEPGT